MRWLVLLGLLIGLGLVASDRFNSAQTTIPTLTPTANPSRIPSTVEEWRPVFEPTADCPLPCWWGIIPGQTDIQTAQWLLLEAVPAFAEADGIFEIPRLPNEGGYVDTSTLFVDDETNSIFFGLTLGSTDGIVNIINMDGTIADFTDYFDLFNLLAIYGTPTTIRLGGTQTGPDERGLTASRLLVQWESIGLAVPYYRLEITNASVASPVPFTPQCFNHGDVQYTVTLHDPQKKPRLDQIADADEGSLRRVEEVTDYSVEEFVQLLLVNNGCLPTDLLVDKSRPTFTPTPNP